MKKIFWMLNNFYEGHGMSILDTLCGNKQWNETLGLE